MSGYKNFQSFDQAYSGNRFSLKQKLQFDDEDPYKKYRHPNSRYAKRHPESPAWEPNGHNYQGYASFTTTPPKFSKPHEAFYDDKGTGVPTLDENNMTIQDIYRTPFLFLQEHRKNYSNMASTALKGIQSESELSKLFFSDENFKRLQKKIKKEIFNRTNGQFRLEADQEQRDLFISMRAVYMEHARFLPGQIVRQVKRLNQKVVDDIVPGMITEIRQHYGYLKEINKPLTPIPRPQNMSNAGRRTLPSITTVWGVK